MKTLKELKEAGFHCKNFILAPDIRFSYNVKTCNIGTYGEVLNDYTLNLVLSHQRVMKKGSEDIIKEINTANLVAWYPCEDGKKDKYIKYIILVDADGKDLSETVECYCNKCKQFKSVLHKCG